MKILQVVQLTKFDYRLANNIDEELQKLRCRVNYHALRFTKPIQELGQKLVLRMRKMTNRFIAVHLRFVPSTKKGENGTENLFKIHKKNWNNAFIFWVHDMKPFSWQVWSWYASIFWMLLWWGWKGEIWAWWNKETLGNITCENPILSDVFLPWFLVRVKQPNRWQKFTLYMT